MNYINKSEEINVDHELIFALINNVGEYHKFLPWCSDSKIISDIDNKIVDQISRNEFLFFLFRLCYIQGWIFHRIPEDCLLEKFTCFDASGKSFSILLSAENASQLGNAFQVWNPSQLVNIPNSEMLLS